MKFGQIKRFGEHENAFGFLRLLFASLVIVAHTPALVDGDEHRELVIRTIGGHLTFGGLAVSGFFIISGFLITGSYLSSSGPMSYLRKRLARIYPEFLVMFVVCALLVRPLGGGAIGLSSLRSVAHELRLALTLQPPGTDGAFAGLHYPALNGAVWTIPYEFKCYLLVLLLGFAGLLRRPWVPAFGCAVCLFLAGLAPAAWLTMLSRLPLASWWLGWAQEAFRMTGLFLAGSTFYLIRRSVPLSRLLVAISAAGLLLCLIVHPLANIGLALFGSYLIFAAAEAGSRTFLKRINNETDISYGLYLYAWPVEQLLILAIGTSSLVALGSLTWAIAAGLGWLSWTFVEKPVKRWRSRGRPQRSYPSGPTLPLPTS